MPEMEIKVSGPNNELTVISGFSEWSGVEMERDES